MPADFRQGSDSPPVSLPAEYEYAEFGCRRCHDLGFLLDRSQKLDSFDKQSANWYVTKRIPCPECRPEPKPYGLPGHLENATFESFNIALNPGMKAAKYACEAVARGDKWCAFLVGDPGLGKSHLAAAALNVRGGAFWEVAALLLNIRNLAFSANGPHYDEEAVIATWENYRQLLVLDDMGQEKHNKSPDGGPGWVDQTLYTILNARYKDHLPTIITSNYADRIADPILSRYSEGSVVCTGADIRRQKR